MNLQHAPSGCRTAARGLHESDHPAHSVFANVVRGLEIGHELRKMLVTPNVRQCIVRPSRVFLGRVAAHDGAETDGCMDDRRVAFSAGPDEPMRGWDAVYQRIKEEILDGVRRPGEILVETRIAREYALSRTPVRRALTRLAAEHMVVARSKRGLVVRSVTATDLQDQYAVRAVLEGFAAACATTNVTADECRQLRDSIDRMEAATNVFDEDRTAALSELSAANDEFHTIIRDAARNPVLERLLREVTETPLVRRSFRMYTKTDAEAVIVHHRDILDALDGADADRADRAMNRHVRGGLNVLLKGIQREEESAG